MNLRPIMTFAAVVLLHFILFFLIWNAGANPHDKFERAILTTAHSTKLSVSLINKFAFAPAVPTVTHLQNPTIVKAQESSDQIEDLIQNNSPTQSQPTALYIAAGLLTKLPTPAEPIDLDIGEHRNLLIPKEIEFNILIDANGAVVDAKPTPSTDIAAYREYVDHISARFKNARFLPGEIDGKAVNTELAIVVASELPSATTSK